jgi:hypothetical protein
LAGLIDTVVSRVESFGVIKAQTNFGVVYVAYEDHEGYDGCASTSFSMVAVNGDNSIA